MCDIRSGTIDRRGFLGVLGAAGALVLLGRAGLAGAEVVPRAQNVVLVHGLYADGSSWASVIGLLQDADFPSSAKTFPAPPASAGVVITDGFAQLSEAAFMNDFANGVEARVARQLYAAQASNVATLTSEKTTAAAWRSKPSWYAVSRQDRTINPDLERLLAKRMNATTIEVDSGHLSLVSHPREIADLILAAAGRDRGQG